jgi:predicted nucleotidyltransferase
MDKKIDKQITKSLNKYISAICKDYKIDGAYLFGSYARGTQKFESDIDIAVLLPSMDSRFQERINLVRYAWDIDSRIEPHPIKTEDYNNLDSMLAYEIKQYGIKIA